MRNLMLSTFTLLIASLFSQIAFADRQPNPEERSAIEKVLRDAGYSSWGEIELDDGRWEVDDAQAEDGNKYDLELAAGADHRIVKRERDD